MDVNVEYKRRGEAVLAVRRLANSGLGEPWAQLPSTTRTQPAPVLEPVIYRNTGTVTQ